MLKSKLTGVHIIADLYVCDFRPIMDLDADQIRENISRIILKNSLSELGNYYHFFDAKTSFTAVISLIESHISMHTWPEDQYVSIDVFVCNYTQDKRSNADQVCDELIQLFNPQQHKKRVIYRNRKMP